MKKTILIPVILLLNTLMMACGNETSSASKYLDAIHSGDLKPAVKPAPTPNPPVVNPPAVNPPLEKPPVVATGNAENGKLVLKTCQACHASGKTKLTTDVIAAKLNAAYTGAQKGTHGDMKESFEGQGRLDLEAALKLIP